MFFLPQEVQPDVQYLPRGLLTKSTKYCGPDSPGLIPAGAAAVIGSQPVGLILIARHTERVPGMSPLPLATTC